MCSTTSNRKLVISLTAELRLSWMSTPATSGSSRAVATKYSGASSSHWWAATASRTRSRVSAGVAWASFEMPKAGPRYRAGIEFFDADATAVGNWVAKVAG